MVVIRNPYWLAPSSNEDGQWKTVEISCLLGSDSGEFRHMLSVSPVEVAARRKMAAAKILDYDPTWPALFEKQKCHLVKLVGDLIDGIHHIGSTSVPGLCAKPKIDIDAVLCSDLAVDPALARVKALSTYEFHGDHYGKGMWTFTRSHGSYGIRLYFCNPNNAVHRERILFRDWLRAHPEDAADYASLKRKLAAEAIADWNFYTDGKAEFVAKIVQLAVAQKSKGPQAEYA